MDPRVAIATTLAAMGAVAGLAWLWAGRAPGVQKRLVFRFSLLGLAVFLVWLGRRSGVFTQASPPFAGALGLTVLLIVIGNLYAVRFCSCGRMHRNLKTNACSRCGALLPRHGLTEELRRAPLDPTDPLGRRRARKR